jgi:NADPH2:quinone reductase
MSKAIRIHRNGGPEVLTLEDVEVGDPGPGQIRLRQTFIGINFIDTYQRSGLYKVPLPFTPGSEGAGVVEAVGPGVSDIQVGQRVAYAGVGGAYAEVRLLPAERAIRLPADVDDRTAAAVMLKGMTAQYLVRQVRPLGPSDTMLFHAAAGGVGLLATQWARSLGVSLVIGTAGSPEKAALAREHGCHEVIEYRHQDFVARVKELTGGKGVNVVYDSVGNDTFMRSLDCLVPRGTMVSFGQSSGPVPPFDILTLSTKGSLSLTRPTLVTFIDTREKLVAVANDLLGVIERGAVKVQPPRVFPLAEAAAAQTALEGRQTVGSTLLAV